MTVLGKFKKQPAEILDYDVSYAEFFSTRTDAPNLTTTNVPTGITLVSQVITGKILKVILSGGTNGITYKITVDMTTTTGIVKEDEFYVTVKEI